MMVSIDTVRNAIALKIVKNGSCARDTSTLVNIFFLDPVEAMHGDFGFTLEYQRPVADVIGDRLALTMVVSLAALIVTWVVALPIGIYPAMHQYSAADYGFTLLGFLGEVGNNFVNN